jgi:hypothetical protein
MRHSAIFSEFGIPIKIMRLINVSWKETCIKIYTGESLSDAFAIQNNLKQGNALSPLLSNFALDYIYTYTTTHTHTHTRVFLCVCNNVNNIKNWLQLNETHKLLVYADDVDLSGENTNFTKKGIDAVLDARKEVGLEINSEITVRHISSRN